jgi:hypothetical protein
MNAQIDGKPLRSSDHESNLSLRERADQRALTSPEMDPSRFGKASSNTTAMRHG